MFAKKGNFVRSNRWFALFEDSIYYFKDQNDSQPKGWTQLDWDLRVEVIREKIEKRDE